MPDDQNGPVIDALKTLHQGAMNRWEKRRGYEWTLNYAVWTALAGFIAYIVVGIDSTPKKCVPLFPLAVSLVVICLIHGFYLWRMTTMSIEDLETVKRVENTLGQVTSRVGTWSSELSILGSFLISRDVVPGGDRAAPSWGSLKQAGVPLYKILGRKTKRRYGALCPIAFTVLLACVSDWSAWQSNKMMLRGPSAAPRNPSSAGDNLAVTVTQAGLEEPAVRFPLPPERWTGPDLGGTWPLFLFCIAAIGTGALLLLFGESRTARAAGAAALISGLTMSGYLVKELKIGDIFKFENKFDFQAQIEAEFKKLGGIGPEPLGNFERFEIGSSELTPAMTSATAQVCRTWMEHMGKGNEGLLLVIGATDRLRLEGAALARYESNFGLARARAERVKRVVSDCGVPAAKMIALVSGPQTTPDGPQPPVQHTAIGYPDDRRVDVWAFWHSKPNR